MISCLLIQVARNPHGLAVCKESVITGEVIDIGRGPACKIHLPDHRVNLLHATIKHAENSTLYIEGEKNVTLEINGFITQNAALPVGTRFEIGPYLLIVEPFPNEHDLALSVELIDTLPEQDITQQKNHLTLASLNWSKRKMGFALAACILFLFLFLPLLPEISSLLENTQTKLPVTLNQSWNPGPISTQHNMFGGQCSTCHQRPFRRVADSACSACHKSVKHHLKSDDLHSGKFIKSHCTDCHQEHKGDQGLVDHNPETCVACHANLKAMRADTRLSDVHDFDTDHPQFHLTYTDGERALQDGKTKITEHSMLKYSHLIHLAPKGVSSPQGDTILQCRDCHKLEDSGQHFAPMTMKSSCQQSECHTLSFGEPVEGDVPHGSEREVMNRLRIFYTQWLVDGNEAPCVTDATSKNLLDCAATLARENAGKTLFNTKALPGEELACGECHEIKPSEDTEVPWKILPLKINRDWQPGASFNHAKHASQKCTACHDKVNSKRSEDISIPGIEKCRECHTGSRPAKGKIRSSCESCHRFHRNENT